MEDFPNLIALGLDDEYNINITGFGDIYEVMSIKRLVRSLKRRYGGGTLYLASNSDHSGRGLNLDELEGSLRDKGISVSEKGYVDSPPWLSKPRSAGSRNTLVDNRLLVILAMAIFKLMLPSEPMRQGKDRSHMVYCFTTGR